jgi:hypothetical protein
VTGNAPTIDRIGCDTHSHLIDSEGERGTSTSRTARSPDVIAIRRREADWTTAIAGAGHAFRAMARLSLAATPRFPRLFINDQPPTPGSVMTSDLKSQDG